MSNVVPFPPMEVDAAWTKYAALAERAIADPHLLTDRKFFEEYTLAEARFKELFLAGRIK